MRIGIYIEHGSGNGVGGAELAMAYLASSWSRRHEVDLIHHRPALTRERLALFSTDDYSAINIRLVPRENEPAAPHNPIDRLRLAREWERDLSAPYDVFVNCTHWRPSFCHARRGALLVLFPFYVRPSRAADPSDRPNDAARWKQACLALYQACEWRLRVATYTNRFAISEFSRTWARRRWGIDCTVLYPPVDVDVTHRPEGSKDRLVVSVGRFSTRAHTKKQLALMASYRALQRSLDGWSYACVGGLNDREENHLFFDRVVRAGRECRAMVKANLDRRSLLELLQRARIFWHATGFDDDTGAHPELAEHFGIATVEAMAAGCVPVVIDKGGLREIVRHGETGFLWNTLDELEAYTMRLAEDDALWLRMSRAARARARRFARPRFVERLSQACAVC